jgi:hypothetical protein
MIGWATVYGTVRLIEGRYRTYSRPRAVVRCSVLYGCCTVWHYRTVGDAMLHLIEPEREAAGRPGARHGRAVGAPQCAAIPAILRIACVGERPAQSGSMLGVRLLSARRERPEDRGTRGKFST